MLFALLALPVLGADYYVSAGGSPLGDGGMARPWDFQTAMNHPLVQPGDTVWVRGGVYAPADYVQTAFRYSLHGTSLNPIIVRNYSGERATLDARGAQFFLQGELAAGYVRFWGLEFIDSLKASNPYDYAEVFSGPNGACNDVRLINSIIHDSGTVTGGGPYVGYGNVIYYAGRNSREHGFYWQNDFKTTGCKKYIQDNIIASVSGYGIHSYSVNGNLNGYVIEGNAIWNSGIIGPAHSPNILLGGGQPVDVADIRENYIYSIPGPWTTGIQVGYSAIPNLDVTLVGNYIAAKWPFIVDEFFQSLTWTNNTAHAYGLNVVQRMNLNQGPYSVDRNTYTNEGSSNTFELNSSGLMFDQWKTATGFDAGSTLIQGPSARPLDAVFVRPNSYEPGRGHVIIYNWSKSPSVNVDLSSILQQGDSYEVRAAQDYFGAAVLSGSYQGGNVSFPMTGISLAAPIPFPGMNQPLSTFPEFGVFVVVRRSMPAAALTISEVRIASVGPSDATTSWLTNDPADSQVEYGTTTSYGQATPLNSSLVTSRGMSMGGLSEGTTYHYRVKSRDAAGNLATSGDFTFTTTDATAPVISGVGASSITASSATISWSTNEASDSLVEYGTTTSYGSSTPLNSSMVTAHTAGLSGLAGGTTYHYRVKSRDAAGNLATSADFTFATTDATAPVISGVGASSITASSATISWSTNEASDSLVEYGTTTSYGSASPLNSSMVTAHGAGLTGLAGGTTYHYRVKSRDAAGNLATSGDLTFTTANPLTISNISAKTTASSATITWTTNAPSNSQVEYGTTASYGQSTPLDSSLVASHSVKLSSLAKSTTFHYRVKSRDAAGTLVVSGDFVFTTSGPRK